MYINEIALSQIFPSGREIRNDRMSSFDNDSNNSPYEYRNIRDDRVYTFFDTNGSKPYTFTVRLNATYKGRFYLPPVYVEAKYEIQATEKVNVGEGILNYIFLRKFKSKNQKK